MSTDGQTPASDLGSPPVYDLKESGGVMAAFASPGDTLPGIMYLRFRVAAIGDKTPPNTPAPDTLRDFLVEADGYSAPG